MNRPTDEDIVRQIPVGDLPTEGIYTLEDGRLVIKELPHDPLIFCGKCEFEDGKFIAQLFCSDPDCDNWIILCEDCKGDLLKIRRMNMSAYLVH